jgi:hypothetical protein
VRDAVLTMLPSLVRIFAASENVISLVPRSPQDDAMAEQATTYINYVFWQDNPGFLTLYGAIKDALTVRTGFVKWWTDTSKEIKRSVQNISLEQLHADVRDRPPRRAGLDAAKRDGRHRCHGQGPRINPSPASRRAAGRDEIGSLRANLRQVSPGRP